MKNTKIIIGTVVGVASTVAGIFATKKIVDTIKCRRCEKEFTDLREESVKKYNELKIQLEKLEKVHAEALQQFKEFDIYSTDPEKVVDREVLRNQINFTAESYEKIREELNSLAELWTLDMIDKTLGYVIAVTDDDLEELDENSCVEIF